MHNIFILSHCCLRFYLIFLSLSSFSPLSDTGRVEQKLEQASSARRDLEDSSKQVRSLEKQLKSMKQERDDLQKVQF